MTYPNHPDKLDEKTILETLAWINQQYPNDLSSEIATLSVPTPQPIKHIDAAPSLLLDSTNN